MAKSNRTLLRVLVLGLAIVMFGVWALVYFSRLPVAVRASYETDPVPSGTDAADDVCIWIHPSEPKLSLIVGTDKDGGIAVYDLEGKQRQYLKHGRVNNVDLRYRFPFPRGQGALVAASERSKKLILCYTVNVENRELKEVGRVTLEFEPYGLCMYYSKKRGAYDCFVTSTDGLVEQWHLFWQEGAITGKRERSFRFDGKTEGCVADDGSQSVYFSEERRAVWKLPAEPDTDPGMRKMICKVGYGRAVSPDAEGLAIYHNPMGVSYLLISSQGNDSFAVFRMDSDECVGRFRISGGAVDKVTHTDGIDVTNMSLPPLYPQGLFVAQDDRNDRGNQNFKLIRWDDIAKSFNPQLEIDFGWDPRKIGAETKDMEQRD